MRFLSLFFFIAIKFNAFCQPLTYFNGSPSTSQPQLFAGGIVSDEFGNRDMAISPAGDELFYTLQYLSGRSFSTIMYSKKTKGVWSQPEVAWFCGKFNNMEPAFSPDGNRIYFVSDRPLTDSSSEAKDYDIWFLEKNNGSWGIVQRMKEPVNSDQDEFYPSITRSGNIYFTRKMGAADEDIVMCKFLNNNFDTAISLPPTINSNSAEFNAFVDPDEKFIIFTGYKRKNNFGSGDLFISYRKQTGDWTAAENLGETVNSTGLTYCPYVSPDKKHFFFSSSRGLFKSPFKQKQNFKELKAKMHEPLNGWDNIYWMDALPLLKVN